MAQANPPPHLQIPLAFRNSPEVLRFFEKQQFIIYQLWQRTGGATDEISETTDIQFSAQLSDLNARLGSGNFLTSDETGFTVDSTKLTVDQDEA